MFGISWWIWTGIALFIAAIYSRIYPIARAGTTMVAWQRWLLRWGHTVVWLVLAVSFATRALASEATQVANAIAFLALPLYGLFLMTMIKARQ